MPTTNYRHDTPNVLIMTHVYSNVMISFASNRNSEHGTAEYCKWPAPNAPAKAQRSLETGALGENRRTGCGREDAKILLAGRFARSPQHSRKLFNGLPRSNVLEKTDHLYIKHGLVDYLQPGKDTVDIEPDDPKALYQALLGLIRDPACMLGQQAQPRAKNLPRGSQVQKIERVYEEVLSK